MAKDKAQGSTITLDFSDYPDELAHIHEQAKRDDRTASNWLRRYVVTTLPIDKPTLEQVRGK
jgi:hypothetical protein